MAEERLAREEECWGGGKGKEERTAREEEEEEGCEGAGGEGLDSTTPTLLLLLSLPCICCSSSALCARKVSLDCQGLPMNAVPSSKVDSDTPGGRESMRVRWEEEEGGGLERKGLTPPPTPGMGVLASCPMRPLMRGPVLLIRVCAWLGWRELRMLPKKVPKKAANPWLKRDSISAFASPPSPSPPPRTAISLPSPPR